MARSRSSRSSAPETGARTEGEELSYEALRRVERAEMRIPRLTRVEPAFWQRLHDHLARLRQAFAEEQEREPTSRRTVLLADELRNTERLVSSIWEVRERKIVQEALAALRMRDRGRPEPPANLTPEEADLHRRLLEVLDEARGSTVGRKAAPAPPRDAAKPPAAKAETSKPAVQTPAAPALVLVRALEDIPEFAGPDLASYRLEKDEVGTLPEAAARLLARRGKVRFLPAGTPRPDPV